MKEIPLANNKGIAIVDDEDYERVSKYKWRIHNGYALTAIRVVGGKLKSIPMHRLVMNAPDGLHVDHIHHNKLDNRKSELRLCTQKETARNRLKHRSHKGMPTQSRFKGVYRCRNRWLAQINSKHIGCFRKEIEAAKAYNEEAIKQFDEFALLNPIDPVIVYSPNGSLLEVKGLTCSLTGKVVDWKSNFS